MKKVQDDEGYGYRIPFQQAVELAGTEKRLRVGQKKQTVSTWRKLGVPSHAVLRILLERMEAREITPPENVPMRRWSTGRMKTGDTFTGHGWTTSSHGSGKRRKYS